MKMHSQKYTKIANQFLLGLISVATLPCASAIPTTISPITAASVSKTSTFQLNTVAHEDTLAPNHILFGNQQNSESLPNHNSLTDEKTSLQSNEILNNIKNESVLNSTLLGSNKHLTTTGINNNNNNSPEEQLTALSADQNNTPSISSLIRSNEVLSDLGDGTSLPFLSSTDSMRQTSDNNNIGKDNLQNDKEQQTESPAPKYPKAAQSDYEANRFKRSHYYNINPLHSNLDDLLNIRRQRRALRFKRNTDYEDFLASLLAAAAEEEAKYNDNYNPSLPTSQVDLEVNPQILHYLRTQTNEDDDNYVDLDKLSQYYYDNIYPLSEIDSEIDSTSNPDSASQELPAFIESYAQQVIPVLPYPQPNRYQRIRREYYNKYEPLSIYSGLKRKRKRNNSYDTNRGEWGRIVGGRDERSAYDDGAEEANKIYSLATLLATGKAAEDYSQRYKRSVKPVMNIM